MKEEHLVALTVQNVLESVRKHRVLSEIVTRRGSVKKLFLKISRNSQENTCARVSALRDFGTGFFCEFCKSFNSIHRYFQSEKILVFVLQN